MNRVEKVLKSKVEPTLPLDTYESLSTINKVYVYHLLLQETRARDFEQISEFLGDDKVISTTKEIISVFFSPLITLYQQADLSTIFGGVSHFLKKVIDTTETAKQNPDRPALIQSYQKSISEFIELFYQFLHKSVVADNAGFLKSLADWLTNQMVFFKKNSSPFEVNLQQLIDQNLNPSQKTQLFKELDSLTLFYKQKAEERKQKISEILKVEAPSQNELHLLHEYINEDDMDDINFGEEIDEIDDFTGTPTNPLPKLEVLPKLVAPFHTLVTDRMLKG